jgi:hypothetical protein
MAVRIRIDGRVVCAATHPERPTDFYIDDTLHYILAQRRALVTEPMICDPSNPGRGGHSVHGEWWWCHEVPEDVVLESR